MPLLHLTYNVFPYTTLFRSYAYPPSSPQPGAVVVREADSGSTIHVRQGDAIRVYLGGNCPAGGGYQPATSDRKSTRLNSSHSSISYAVFCLKKKRTIRTNI